MSSNQRTSTSSHARARGPRWLALLLCASWTIACRGDDDSGENDASSAARCPERISDSLGNEFGYDCDEPFEVALLPSSPQPPDCEDGESFFRVHPSERLLRICYFEGDPESSGSTSADRCRPLACGAQADCPGAADCRNGLCQFSSAEITGEDALVLCLADVQWPTACYELGAHPDLNARIAALEACLEDDEAPCEVPAICRQP